MEPTDDTSSSPPDAAPTAPPQKAAAAPQPEAAERSTTREIDDASLRRLTLYSLTSAICAVIPIPLLDDHLLRRTRRRMVREIAQDAGFLLSDPPVKHLSGTERSTTWGCVLGLVVATFFKVIWKIVRRFFRTIVFFLLIKDAANAASATFHEGFLLRLGMPRLVRQLTVLHESGRLGEVGEVPPEVVRLRNAVESTCNEVDPRPLQNTLKSALRGSRRLLRGAARLLMRRARRAEKENPAAEPAPEEGAELAPGLVEAMLRAFARETHYIDSLAAQFRRRFDTDPAGAASGQGSSAESHGVPER